MRIFFGTMMVLVAGCATLQTGHSNNVKAFARSAKTLSVVPGVLYQDISDYRHQLKLIESSTIYASDKIVPRLNRLFEIKTQFEKNAAQINQSALLIGSYAECLLALTDDGYSKQIGKESDGLSLQLNAALKSYNQAFNKSIPTNAGNFIGGIVTQIGSIKLRQLQRKYLQSFVDTGAHIINEVCDYFTSVVAVSLDNELASLDQQFANIMTTFYDNILEHQKTQNVNPFDYLKQYNPLYLDMKEKLTTLHDLKLKTITSMQRIKEAHEKLRVSVDLHQSTELIAEIQELYTATNQVQFAYKKLRN